MRWSLVFGVFFSFAISGPLDAQACSFTPEAGIWENNDAERQQLAVVEIKTDCVQGQKVIYLRSFVKCAPRNCKWGRTPMRRLETGELYAVHKTFSADRHVKVKRDKNDQLVVHLWSIYRDGREDNGWEIYRLLRES